MAAQNTCLFKQAVEMLKRNVDYNQFPQQDGLEEPKVGYGLRLWTRGIDLVEAEWLLDRDVQYALNRLSSLYCWSNLTDGRKLALVDVAVGLGYDGLLKLPKFLAYLDLGAYERAAVELLDRLPPSFGTTRAFADAAMIRDGVVK